MPRLLCITAHPDDEAGGFGGTLALYTERGVEISAISGLIGLYQGTTFSRAESHSLSARHPEGRAHDLKICSCSVGRTVFAFESNCRSLAAKAARDDKHESLAARLKPCPDTRGIEKYAAARA